MTPARVIVASIYIFNMTRDHKFQFSINLPVIFSSSAMAFIEFALLSLFCDKLLNESHIAGCCCNSSTYVICNWINGGIDSVVSIEVLGIEIVLR